MNATEILEKVAQLLPILKQVGDIIDVGEESDVDEVVEIAQQLTEPVKQLIGTVNAIKTQTEETHVEVWAKVSGDWNSAVQGWLNKP